MAPRLIIFNGGLSGSPVEDMVAEAQRCVTLDTIQRARESGVFGGIILATDSADLAGRAGTGVTVELDRGPFRFGLKLRDTVREHQVDFPFYIGGGAGALLTPDDFASIAALCTKDTVVTNNLFSADLVAFRPGTAIEVVEPPEQDNPLALLLRDQAGLREVCLPRNAATQFDMDTPSDLLVLSLHPGIARNVKGYLESLRLDVSRLRQVMPLLTDVDAEVVVAGRVGSQVWAHLEAKTACRVRLFSEERGMRADGREARGEARSLVGLYIQEVGLRRFFRTLAELGQAAFIDSRVVFAHMGLRPSASDRFLSDLGRPEEIVDDFVREFTAEALRAPMPVVLGGHSMVAGGLLALIDAAWRENNPAAGEDSCLSANV